MQRPAAAVRGSAPPGSPRRVAPLRLQQEQQESLQREKEEAQQKEKERQAEEREKEEQRHEVSRLGEIQGAWGVLFSSGHFERETRNCLRVFHILFIPPLNQFMQEMSLFVTGKHKFKGTRHAILKKTMK